MLIYCFRKTNVIRHMINSTHTYGFWRARRFFFPDLKHVNIQNRILDQEKAPIRNLQDTLESLKYPDGICQSWSKALKLVRRLNKMGKKTSFLINSCTRSKQIASSCQTISISIASKHYG